MSQGPKTSPFDPDSLDLAERTIGDFRVLRKLGQGGMGQVYLAEQISLGRNVALKILRPELAASPQALARFETEARNVARATHANIVQVYAYGVVDGMPYMALEYVEGRNLRDYLNKKGPPELLIAVSIMRQVASALQRAGEMGIVHRDIKPENILLTRKGEVKVADFGLSRADEVGAALNLTATGVTMGTPLYMSPEQVEGKPVDVRTDIYSFGVTCWHMLAGEPPFTGATAFEVALQHVQKPAPPLAKIRPDLPEALGAIVAKMMAKSPDARYQTGRELLRDVVRLREGLSGNTIAAPAGAVNVEPVLDLDPGKTEAFAPPTRRRSSRLWGMALAASLSLGVAAGAGWAVWEHRRGQALPDVDTSRADHEATTPSKKEAALRDAAQQYLNPAGGKVTNEAGGLGVCMDLGLFYLEHGKIEEADKLFTRLEGVAEPKSYKMLGQLGRSITLALTNEPKESNKRWKELFLPRDPLLVLKKKDPPAAVQRAAVERQLAPIKEALASPGWKYWLVRARWYNRENKLPEAEVPPALRLKVPARDPVPDKAEAKK